MINLYSNEIKNISQNIENEIIDIRRELHKYPELGFREFKTSSVIEDFLNNLGLEVRTNIAKTGLLGILRGCNPGKTVALRADMDALPIAETNTFQFASQNNGIMHACGHDIHMSVVLGAAKILTQLKDKINGNIVFIFQPGEEGHGGAKVMINEGVLEDPKVDSIIATHINPSLCTGRISVGTGAVMASPSEFEIKILGKGGHAAEPQNAVDPILIGTHLISLFQGIITREKNPLKSAVLSITYFNAGSSYNIIPDKAIIRGTVRTFDPSLDKFISERLEDITSSVTKAMGANYKFTYKVGYPPVINNSGVVSQILKSAKKVIKNSDNIITESEPVMLAEDFSYYSMKIPGALFNLGCLKEPVESTQNLHSSDLNPDEKCIKTGMEIMSQYSIDFLNK